MVDDERYSLQELADAAGVSPRTVRYYIAEGLLPPPEPAGHRTSYSREQLSRLKLIGLLKEAYLPLKQIRSRLAGLERDELERALAEAERARISGSTIVVDEDVPDFSPIRDHHERAPFSPSRTPAASPRSVNESGDEDALAYIDRVLGKKPAARSNTRLPLKVPPPREMSWRRLAIGTGGEAELMISEALYQRRKDRIDALLVWAEKMLEQD